MTNEESTMKRRLLLFYIITLILTASIILISCEKNEPSISFNTFTVDGNNVYGKVSSDTESFSFINEVKSIGGAKYIVSKNADGTDPVASMTIDLQTGANTVYVIEMIDDEPTTVYTVTVRRNAVYTVSFNSNGGNAILEQKVEEDAYAVKPDDISRLGYDLEGWDYDFTQPVTGDICINAKWKIKPELENFDFTVNGNNLTVTGIKDNTVTKIVIPDYVTDIGRRAFSYCTNLTSVVIPNSVTSIGASAFYKCANLTSVVLPNSITTIEQFTFGNCTNLTSVVIPNSVTSIGASAFYECANLTSIVIPNSVTAIGAYAFYECANLTSVVLPNSITTIEQSTFGNCTNLTSIVIPDSVTTIGQYAFYFCTGLTSVVIPDSVTNIDYYAFAHCTDLTIIKYRGTEDQWNAISKDTYWDKYLSDGAYHKINYTVTYNYKED